MGEDMANSVIGSSELPSVQREKVRGGIGVLNICWQRMFWISDWLYSMKCLRFSSPNFNANSLIDALFAYSRLAHSPFADSLFADSLIR